MSKGASNSNAKLDEGMVRAIRKSTEPNAVIAERFKITRVTVWHIRNRVTWKHVP
jgi:hypothetical protein